MILQASRIEAWKGPDRTLHALARLRDIPGWRLWMAGGPQRHEERALYENLKRIAEEAGIGERVAFLGQRSDVPALMRAADIYCQGNRGPEGFSLAFLEAGFCGLPIVTTDLGGAAEIVDASTGILVPPGEDVTALSEALRSLITDADRRAALRRASPREGDPLMRHGSATPAGSPICSPALEPSHEPPHEPDQRGGALDRLRHCSNAARHARDAAAGCDSPRMLQSWRGSGRSR